MIAAVAGVMVACKNGEKKAEATDSAATSAPVAPTSEAAAPAPAPEAAPAPAAEAAPAADAPKDKVQAEAPAAEKKMESAPKK